MLRVVPGKTGAPHWVFFGGIVALSGRDDRTSSETPLAHASEFAYN